MSEKLSIAEFAKLVGTSAKTIYQRINNYGNLPDKEKLKTVNEKIKGREVTLIITDSEQINLYKSIYGNLPVNESEYYENVTVNNGNIPLNNVNEVVNTNNDNTFNNSVIDRLMTVNEDYNNRILQLTTELITAKQKQLLLEDKAGREGFYIDENNKLQKEIKANQEEHKKVIESKNKLIKWLITVIILLFTVIIVSVTYFLTVNYVNNINNVESEKPSIEQVSTVENVNN